MSLLMAICLIYSCKRSDNDSIMRIVNEWKDKKIVIPSSLSLTSCSDRLIKNDSVMFKKYTVVSYVDSLGCLSCKLQIDKWKEFMQNLDSITNNSVSYLFVFHPKKREKKELIDLLKRERFMYPVYIDENDFFNELNKFPADIMFQTFLTDKNMTVIAIGNPIHNFKIKQLYRNIVTECGSIFSSDKIPNTTVILDKSLIKLGDFDWQNEQVALFHLKNSGSKPLIIENVMTSCGCTKVEYSKEPIQPGKELALTIKYKAEKPEYFNKTITIYCNVIKSPFQLKISGNAK